MRAWTNRPCRGVAGAALALTLVVTVFIGGASASAATKRSDGDSATTSRTSATTSTTGDRGSAAASTPAAPQLLTASGLRPLTRAEADRLTGAQGLRGSACEIDFDDDAAISLLPGNAVDTFAYSPWWNQLCGGNYARIYPTDISHFHLGYVDPAVLPCYDADNPFGTPVGVFARGEDCEPIDTVTRWWYPASWDVMWLRSRSSACASPATPCGSATGCRRKGRGSRPSRWARSTTLALSTAGRACPPGCGTCRTGPPAQLASTSPERATCRGPSTTSASAEAVLLAPDPVVIGIEPVDVGADYADRAPDVGRAVAGAALAVDVAGDWDAAAVVGVAARRRRR